MAIPVSAVAADGNATELRKVSCPLYDISLPEHWTCEYPFDADGMPPVRGTLIFDAAGDSTKCHLHYQSWQFFDIKHYKDTQYCSVQSYILPSGGKVDVEVTKDMMDRLSKHPGWIKIEGGYMKSYYQENEGFLLGPKGAEKVVTQDHVIEVFREGREYVHLLKISVPESRYSSDEEFRRMVDNVWKSWKLKK